MLLRFPRVQSYWQSYLAVDPMNCDSFQTSKICMLSSGTEANFCLTGFKTHSAGGSSILVLSSCLRTYSWRGLQGTTYYHHFKLILISTIFYVPILIPMDECSYHPSSEKLFLFFVLYIGGYRNHNAGNKWLWNVLP